MRPVLIVVSLLLLVALALATGVVAADWPFWQRAWRWHAAAPLPPARLPGAHAWIQNPEIRDLPLAVDSAVSEAASRLLNDPVTGALLVARDDRVVFEYYGADADPAARIDGQELVLLPLVALYGAARERGVGATLDASVASMLQEWSEDARGEITPRQLLQGLSGLEATRGSPLNPFSKSARLAAGPNFERAALGFHSTWPAGSHYAANAVDAQLAATVLVRSTQRPLTELLGAWLVEPLGLASARVLLDRHRGKMAAHCCIQARARDWLTLGLLLAQQGEVGGRRVYTTQFAREIATATPVAPDRGLGVQRVALGQGRVALLVDGRRRLLLTDAATRSAWLWIGAGDFHPEHRDALIAAAGAAP